MPKKITSYKPCEDCRFSPQIAGEWAKCSMCEYLSLIRIEGHWKKVKHPTWRGFTLDKCSVCGWVNEKEAFVRDIDKTKGQLPYCPCCGAPMSINKSSMEEKKNE